MNTTFEHAVMNGTATRQVAIVQETKDHGKFSFMELNRNVNRNHVERLKESFKKEYLLAPILVNEFYQIVDGQHRFTAAKEMGLPVRYVVAQGYTIEHVKMLNHEGKNWSLMDHFMSHVKAGVPAYVRTAELFVRYEQISSGTIASIVYKFSSAQNSGSKSLYESAKRLDPASSSNKAYGTSKVYADAVKTGNFRASGLTKANQFFQWVFKRAESCPMITSGPYLAALVLLELYNDNYDRDRMAHSIDNYHTIMAPAPNKAIAERQLEEVYNYKRHNRVRLARV